MGSPRTPAARAGFTLIELIMVIVIIGVVAVMIGAFIRLPVEGYVDLGRRAALVDSAEGALRRMARDIRIALPNSVRVQTVGSGFALEILPTLDGGRYFTTSGTTTRDLAFDMADSDFEINGCFQRFTIPASPGTFSTATHRLVIDNLGITGYDVYTATGVQGEVITLPGTTIKYSVSGAGTCGAGVHHINLSTAYLFAQSSPRRRLFVLDTTQVPVTYLCDRALGTLTRYAGYTITAIQPTNPAAAPLNTATTARVADHVDTCGATTTTSTAQSRGLVTLDLGLADQGESVRLIHQVQLDNSR